SRLIRRVGRPLRRDNCRREILPMTALRLTPSSLAISRQVPPRSNRVFRSSTRSGVQTGMMPTIVFKPRVFFSSPMLPPRNSADAFASRMLVVRRFAVVADRQQPVLDRVTDALLDQGPRDPRHAGAMRALPHQSLEKADRGNRKRHGNPVRFGF